MRCFNTARLVGLLLTLLCFFLPEMALAQSDLGSSAELTPTAVSILPGALEAEWEEVLKVLDAGDLKVINDSIFKIRELADSLGQESLEEYSSHLVELGLKSLADNDPDRASFFLRKALQLSPSSPRILFTSLGLAYEVAPDLFWSDLWKAFKQVWHYPDLVLLTLKRVIYPAVWSLTIGLYISLALTFAFMIRPFVRKIAAKLPIHLRFAAPFMVLALICVPVFWGPLWAVFAWAVLLLYFIPAQRRIVAFAGVILLLWGISIPLAQSIGRWLANPVIQAMLQVHNGAHSPHHRKILEQLTQERPYDGVVYYTYGLLLRHLGDLSAADDAFVRAELKLGIQPYTLAQQGALAFIRGDLARAADFYLHAQRLGMNSPEFLLNFSKLRFEQMDTAESRRLFALGAKKDPELAESIRNRELAFGVRSNLAMAEIRLPTTKIIYAAILPALKPTRIHDLLADRLMPGLTSFDISSLGVFLLVISFFRNTKKHKSRSHGYFGEYVASRFLILFARIIPGSAFILSGYMIVGVLCISVLIFLLLPLIGWPFESTCIFEVLPQTQGILALIAICFAVILYSAWLWLEEEEEC